MKFVYDGEPLKGRKSPPAREAWIEMREQIELVSEAPVASREGGVD